MTLQDQIAAGDREAQRVMREMAKVADGQKPRYVDLPTELALGSVTSRDQSQQQDDDVPQGAAPAELMPWEAYAGSTAESTKITAGPLYFKGVRQTVIDDSTGLTLVFDADLATAVAGFGYIKIDFDAVTFRYFFGADPGDGDYKTEYWRLFEVTADGRIKPLWKGDIHIPGNA